MPPLERVAERTVHVAPAAVGQTLVGHRPVQVVAEPEPVAPTVLEEVAERVPSVGGNEVRPVERLGDQRGVDYQAGHRRLAEQDAILRRKLVDPRRDERLDRLGERPVVSESRPADSSSRRYSG